jgi:hypothetical protein
MVKKFFKNKSGIWAKFGQGQVMIRSYLVGSRPAGQLELTTCYKVRPNSDDEIIKVPYSDKIVLDFTTRQSVDILIQKLEDLKSLMEDASYG